MIMYIFSIMPMNQGDIASELIVNELRNNINTYGVIFHFLSVISFLVGAHVATFSYRYSGSKERFFILRQRRFNTIIYLYCLIGVGVILWQISVSVSLGNYLNELIFNIGTVNPEIRSYMLKDRESGGLPGIIKMFSYLPLSALYMVLTYEIVKSKIDRKPKIMSGKTKRYVFFIFITILVRSIFVLDRAVLLSFLVIIVYYFVFFATMNSKKFMFTLLKRPIFYFGTLIVLVFSQWWSYVRQGVGILDTLKQYSSLGLANLSILFESDFDYTLGRSVFAVVQFPLKYFGLKDIFPELTQENWVWNPAKYLTAYAYQDFGVFCIVFFFFLGIFTTLIHLKAWYKLNPYSITVLFALIIAIVSSIVVPLFRGAEWWVSLLMGMIGIKLCFKTPYAKQLGES